MSQIWLPSYAPRPFKECSLRGSEEFWLYIAIAVLTFCSPTWVTTRYWSHRNPPFSTQPRHSVLLIAARLHFRPVITDFDVGRFVWDGVHRQFFCSTKVQVCIPATFARCLVSCFSKNCYSYYCIKKYRKIFVKGKNAVYSSLSLSPSLSSLFLSSPSLSVSLYACAHRGFFVSSAEVNCTII